MTASRQEFVVRKNPLPAGYKLCVIVIKYEAAQRSVKKLATMEEIEPEVFPEEKGFQVTKKFQKLAKEISKDIFGKMYRGPSMLDNLKRAINDLQQDGVLDKLIVATDNLQAARIDTLIVENAVDTRPSQQIALPTESLKLPAGCSIVLVSKTDGDAASSSAAAPAHPPRRVGH